MPRESIGHYTGLGQGILLELNPNILVRDEERMYIVQDSVHFFLVHHRHVGCPGTHWVGTSQPVKTKLSLYLQKKP